MTAHRVAWAPALVAGVTGALSAATVALSRINGESLGQFIAGNEANTWLAGLAFGLVAALVLRDRTENRLGWIFAAVAVLEAVCAASAELATYLFRSGRAGGGADLVAWLGSVLWMPGFLMLLVAVPLLFPDGRLASPRWRWPAAAALLGWTVAVLGYATTDTAVQDGFPQAENPFDLPFPDEPHSSWPSSGSSRPFSSAFSPSARWSCGCAASDSPSGHSTPGSWPLWCSCSGCRSYRCPTP